jgi:hypothetical protein
MPFSFNRTREQLRSMVFRKLGFATVTSADADICYEAIDLRLKEAHRMGIVWRKVDQIPLTFTVSAGVNSASATADVLFPVSLHIMDNSQDEPVDIISPPQYAAISDKTETGLPECAVWNKSNGFTFWPVPLENTTAKLVYERYMDDTSAGAVIDVDVSWLRWMKDIIAYDLSDDFNQPEEKIRRLLAESQIAERNIRKLSVLKVDYEPVRVDDFDGISRRETDYGR